MNKKNKNNVLNFPNLLNSGTILVILVAYIVIILCVTILFVPKNNYTVVPNYEHMMSNNDISSYFKLSTSLIADKNGSVEPKQSLTVVLNDNNLNNDEETKAEILVSYEVSALTNNDKMNYMYSGSRNKLSDLPVNHQLISEKVVGGGNYKELFAKIVYEIRKSESETEKKEYKFSETVLTLSKKEKNSKIQNQTTLKNAISISLSATKSSDADYYSTSSTINIKVLTSIYHLDYQSWIVTESGAIYPVVGFYNVYYSQKPTLTSSNKISTNLNPKYIIAKAIVTDSYGNTQVFFFKDLFENIIR